jgi:hypothetical protein
MTLIVPVAAFSDLNIFQSTVILSDNLACFTIAVSIRVSLGIQVSESIESYSRLRLRPIPMKG